MKLYVNIKKITLDDNIEHDIISSLSNKEFYAYDRMIELLDDDQFIKDTLIKEYKKDKDNKDTTEVESEKFKVREDKTWWSFPLYEIVDDKIIAFDYTKYSYFLGTNRRMALSAKINKRYNKSSEAKIVRKTLKKILDHLGIADEDFLKYNNKVETIIKNNPKKLKKSI